MDPIGRYFFFQAKKDQPRLLSLEQAEKKTKKKNLMKAILRVNVAEERVSRVKTKRNQNFFSFQQPEKNHYFK